MTIDEAIEQFNEAKCGNCPTLFCEECVKGDKRNQIAEWLKELKTYKAYGVINKESFDKRYDKALNDVLEKIKEPTEVKISHWREHDVIDSRQREIIKKIKKLKAGVKNDD